VSIIQDIYLLGVCCSMPWLGLVGAVAWLDRCRGMTWTMPLHGLGPVWDCDFKKCDFKNCDFKKCDLKT
jgi:hypothetical protein